MVLRLLQTISCYDGLIELPVNNFAGTEAFDLRLDFVLSLIGNWHCERIVTGYSVQEIPRCIKLGYNSV